MFDSKEIEELKTHSGTLALYLSRVNLKKDSKGEYTGLCPFHSEKTPSLKCNAKGWFCFGCGQGGDILSFVSKFDNIGFTETVEKVKQELGIGQIKNLPEKFASTKIADKVFQSINGQDKAISFSLSDYFKFESALAESQDGQDWLKSRGIKYETAKSLHVGYRQEVKKSWLDQKDHHLSGQGWICFPAVSGEQVLSIKYRSIKGKCFCRQPGMAKGENTPLFNSGTIDALDPVYVTEGEPDAVILEQNGFKAVSVQSASTPLTAANKEKLLESDYIILAGDNDQTGSDYMDKALREIQERIYKLTWPEGLKDANQTFLEAAKGDKTAFIDLVNSLTAKAKYQSIPGITSLQEAMMKGARVGIEDLPSRLKLPWKSVDSMANILPGNVLYIFATQTGTGKTSFLANILAYASMHGEVVLNYSAELSEDEYANLVASHLLRKNRNELVLLDYQQSARMMGDARFYIGYSPDLYKADDVLDLIEAGIRRYGATLVSLDHIHYVVRNEIDTIKAQENVMKRIKNIAIRYGVKWINIGQPRKPSQQSRGKIALLTDSKGSEAVYSDANAAIILHRDLSVPDAVNPPKEPFQPLCEVHLLKGRSQGAGNAFTQLMFDGKTATFYELSKDKEPEGLFHG